VSEVAKDFILEISYPSSLDDIVHSRLYLTRTSGSSTSEVDGRTTLAAYFVSAAERDAARALFADLDVALTAAERDRVDWLERYQQSLEPIDIGRHFVVAPDRSLIPARTMRRPILIPQEQAFGTGSHESTALCMEMLETIDVDGRLGLDVGSGSGILAIAMFRLGARKVIAFDNDLDTFGALRDNRLRNEIADERMPVFIGGLESLRSGTFDVITMNILPEVILPLLPQVLRHMHGETALILSGILLSWRGEVTANAADEGLQLRDEKQKGEWWCGAFQRRVSAR
jgi:ribosomal protein L11 methyltransferase